MNSQQSRARRKLQKPNILITGTPGCGKTSTAENLCSENPLFSHIDLSKLIAEKSLHQGRDEEFDCFILDEDKVCDELEERMEKGGQIVDFHSVSFFPERWFDLVVVLRTNNTILYERLERRGYSQKKVQENIQCEIMQVILEEARESYDESIIWELQSDSVEQLEENVSKILAWASSFRE